MGRRFGQNGRGDERASRRAVGGRVGERAFGKVDERDDGRASGRVDRLVDERASENGAACRGQTTVHISEKTRRIARLCLSTNDIAHIAVAN